MFSRLSIVARIALVQVVLVFAAIIFAGGMLKLTGRSKYYSDNIRANAEDIYKPALLSEWLRSHGWTLLGLPAATMIVAAWLRRRGHADDEMEWISGATAVFLFLLVLGGGIQPMARKNFIFLRTKSPAPSGETQTPEPKNPSPAE